MLVWILCWNCWFLWNWIFSWKVSFTFLLNQISCARLGRLAKRTLKSSLRCRRRYKRWCLSIRFSSNLLFDFRNIFKCCRICSGSFSWTSSWMHETMGLMISVVKTFMFMNLCFSLWCLTETVNFCTSSYKTCRSFRVWI